MRIAGSLPFLPHRLMVSGETRRISATSRMVKRSGKSSKDIFVFFLFMTDMVPYYRVAGNGCQEQDKANYLSVKAILKSKFRQIKFILSKKSEISLT